MKKIYILIILIPILFLIIFLPKKQYPKMINLTGKTVEEIESYAKENNLKLVVKKEYSEKEKGTITQSIPDGEIINENDELIITISLGEKIDYSEYNVNELGNVPIMMYHGIHNTDSKYIGGNVDKDGYQRTSQAFINDLEFYYKNNYRMIRLNDYINGIVDVELGKSPIILTFDDGLENNIKVLGLDDKGDIIIDPYSAVGILESFKTKYPDFNVTATFFVNGGLFNQSQYNEKILKWLIKNGYDIGNHSYSHADFTKITKEKSVKEIGSMYNLLDKYIPGEYVNIVALPFGSPYKKNHENYASIISGVYNGKEYKTESTLRVGWEADYSPFSVNFNSSFLKRIRAYDNNGKEFDIEMNFKILENNRYISDGDKNTIVVKEEMKEKIAHTYDLDIITY